MKKLREKKQSYGYIVSIELWHVNDTTYTFFTVMEKVIRHLFTTKQLDQLSQENSKEQMIEHLMHNGDILFQWCFLTTSTQESVASLLLQQIVELYITIRGFRFATSCVEMHV